MNTPLEIWIMIVNEIGASDNLRSAWLWCRPICQLAKQATEAAVRIKVLPRLRLDIFNEGKFVGLYTDWRSRVRTREFVGAHFLFPFDSLSTDGLRAIFRPSQERKFRFVYLLYHYGGKTFTSPPIGHGLEMAMSFDWGQGTLKDVLCQQWKKHLESLEEARQSPPGNRHFQPYVTSSCAAAIPPESDMDLDLETLEISISWCPLVNLLMKEEELIGQGLKESAIADAERTLRLVRTPSVKEEALKIALSSKICRWGRFSKALEVAAMKRTTDRCQQYGNYSREYHMELRVDNSFPNGDLMLLYNDEKSTRLDIPSEATAMWYEEWKSHLLTGIAEI